MPWWWWLSPRLRAFRRRERAALPDGTRVRLSCGCPGREHDGVWLTSWTPRRTGFLDDPDDYQLEREGDGRTTYATRGALVLVGVAP